MHVYFFTEPQQNFSSLLDQAKEEDAVQIVGKDEQLFTLLPATPKKSPLDITGVNLNMTSDEIVGFIREGREKF